LLRKFESSAARGRAVAHERVEVRALVVEVPREFWNRRSAGSTGAPRRDVRDVDAVVVQAWGGASKIVVVGPKEKETTTGPACDVTTFDCTQAGEPSQARSR
jgi:hypothetical protein